MTELFTVACVSLHTCCRHARQRGEPDGLRCKLPPEPAAAATASLHLFGGLPAYVHEVSDRDAALYRLPDLLLDVPLKASPRVRSTVTRIAIEIRT